MESTLEVPTNYLIFRVITRLADLLADGEQRCGMEKGNGNENIILDGKVFYSLQVVF